MLRTCRSTLPILLWLVVVSWSTFVSAETLPHWIWLDSPSADQTVRVRKSFEVTGAVKSATLLATTDNACTVFVNGQRVLRNQEWKDLARADVLKQVAAGRNVLAVEGKNQDGAAGILVALKITLQDGQVINVVSDSSWSALSGNAGKWEQPDFDDSQWAKAKDLGVIGKAGLPWSGSINVRSLEDALNDDPNFREALPTVAKHVRLPEGFVAEELFQVPRPMGSWVSLALDPKGRLIASDQGGAGLFLITPGNENQPTTVQKMPVQISGFQGMTWAFDSLYGMVNGGPNNGLHRLRDTDGDGLMDTSELLMPIEGSGEHGPHAVIPSPDGKSLYVCSGNHTKLPSGITSSQVPQVWGEDLLLPRRWDANGHAAGILAPGGWIMKITPDAKEREVVSIGYRNEYDIAFNADGELFSYDADMEWDFGSPWYRPTRVCHATGGSEFGWRSGTGKWPAYYEDSLPGTIDIGPGSPVGITFGYGAKFPEKYQKALFLLDWTYSTIYAVHLTPDQSTYSATLEEFAVGQPMQVTDGIIGADGAFYYTAGGRGTQSSLYRVRYTGTESTAPADLKDPRNAQNRAERHQLEAMLGQPGKGDLNLIFSRIGSSDRFLRFAARTALEFQPVDSWKEQALTDSTLSPLAVVDAMIALSRQGTAADLPAVLKRLGSLHYSSLDEQGKLALLRAYQLAFIRLGLPEGEWKERLQNKFDGLYPAKTYPENAELCQLLVALNSPTVVAKTLQIIRDLGPEPVPDWGHLVNRSSYGGTVGKMIADMPPSRGIHFAFALRNQKEHWTLPEREEYFKFFINAATKPGGNSYARFLSQMREDAIQTCSPAEQAALQNVTSVSLLGVLPKVDPPKGPGRKWTREEALAELGSSLTKRNYNKGRELYFAVACGKCHRFDGEGGSIGPDLSTAAKKFPLPDLLDAIIEPSKVISDQYASHQVLTTDGQVLHGRAVEIGDQLHVFTPDADAPPKVVSKKDVEEIQPSAISQMPVGLIDTLNPEELKDLIAYLLSEGNRGAAVYK